MRFLPLGLCLTLACGSLSACSNAVDDGSLSSTSDLVTTEAVTGTSFGAAAYSFVRESGRTRIVFRRTTPRLRGREVAVAERSSAGVWSSRTIATVDDYLGAWVPVAGADAEGRLRGIYADSTRLYFFEERPDGSFRSESLTPYPDSLASWDPTTYDRNWLPASFALDANGDPHVAFFRTHFEPRPAGSPILAGHQVVYARRTAGAWRTEVIFPAAPGAPLLTPSTVSLALGAGGAPVVAFGRKDAVTSLYEVNVASRSPGTGLWTLESLGAGRHPALAAEPSGAIHLAYFRRTKDASSLALIHAAKTPGGAWQSRTAAATTYIPVGNQYWPRTMQDIAVDASGTVHIAFLETWNHGEAGNLRYAYAPAGAAFASTTLVPNRFSFRPSLSVDTSGVARIAYGDEQALRFVPKVDPF